MDKRSVRSAGFGAALALIWLVLAGAAAAQTTLRIFAGNFPKVDTLRSLANAYQQSQAGLTIEIDTGGTRLEAQQQALNALLSSRDNQTDLVLIDILRPAQWTQAQWLEPLDAAFEPEREALAARLFPAYRQAGLVGGRLMALPFSADAMALLYRADLLEKHGVAVPRTLAGLKEAASRVLEAEAMPALRGLDFPSAPVESTVCSLMSGLWGQGHDLLAEGRPALAGEPARNALQALASLKDSKIAVPAPGEGHPERVRQMMQAGNLVFGFGWNYAWQRLQTEVDSQVAGKVRWAPLPGETAETAHACAGGWLIGVTSVSTRKAEAMRFLRYLASPEATRLQAELGDLPVQRAPYEDAQLLALRPVLGQIGPVLEVARLRPASARYGEVSDILRSNLSAFLAGTKTADAALQDMQARLSLIFR